MARSLLLLAALLCACTSNLAPEEATWCATHDGEVRAADGLLKRGGIEYGEGGRLERMTEEERACALAYMLAHRPARQTQTLPPSGVD